MLVDDDEKPLDKRVGYGLKSQWKQWRDTTINVEYDLYDIDMFEVNFIEETLYQKKSWGRSSFVKAMIDLYADIELKDTLVMAVPKSEGDSYILHSIRVYECKPIRCPTCMVFGHFVDLCRKSPKVVHTSMNRVEAHANAYILKLSSPTNHKEAGGNVVKTTNSFELLNTLEVDPTAHERPSDPKDSTQSFGLGKSNVHVNEDSESDVEEIYDETAHFMETMDDDEYDPYNDVVYTTHSLFEEQKGFCDALDVKIRGRRK
nr:hypothetical protein [Tanacetum cinerariifolium]